MTMTVNYRGLGGPAEMTTTPARVVTVHGEVSLPLQLHLLDAIDSVLRDHGIDHIWVDPACRSELVVMMDPPSP